MLSSADLGILLAGHGVPVVVGAEEAVGIMNSQTLEESDDSGIGTLIPNHPTVLVKATDLPSAARHQAATVNGDPYTIRDIRTESHDLMKRLYLVLTTP